MKPERKNKIQIQFFGPVLRINIKHLLRRTLVLLDCTSPTRVVNRKS